MRRAFRSSLFQPASAALALALLGASPDAGAVFVFTPLGNPPSVTLRVGSADTNVNRVTFLVNNAAVSNPTRLPVTGVPGSGAPASTTPNGVEIEVATKTSASFKTYTLTLTADSSANLVCVAGSGCGTWTIPSSAISWTSYNLDTANAPGQDIQSGAFDGSASQPLANYQNAVFFIFGQSVTMRNVLVFQYDNAQLQPAGQYLMRVTYTASFL